MIGEGEVQDKRKCSCHVSLTGFHMFDFIGWLTSSSFLVDCIPVRLEHLGQLQTIVVFNQIMIGTKRHYSSFKRLVYIPYPTKQSNYACLIKQISVEFFNQLTSSDEFQLFSISRIQTSLNRIVLKTYSQAWD